MIAARPKCHTRYRVQPDQLGAEGARLRCSQCSAVFRVRLPRPAPAAAEARREVASPAPAPAGAEPVRAPATAPPAADAAPDEPRFDRERLVLLAHADPDFCKPVAEALEGWGLQVLVAHDGVE